MRFKYSMLVILMVLLLSGCKSEATPTVVNKPIVVVDDVYSFEEEDLNLENVLEMINVSRDTSSEYRPDIEDYVYKTEEDFTVKEAEMLLADRSFEYKTLSKEEALEDVDDLFRIFKNHYGGYTLFGGDQVFDEARLAIENEINKVDKIATYTLDELLGKELSFINDGHMRIGSNKINEDFIIRYYANENIPFYNDRNGFYKLEDGTRKYVLSIDDDTSIETYMKLSLDEDGKFVYYLGLLLKDEFATKKVNIEYKDNGSSEEMQLVRSSKKSNRNKVTYEEEIIDGVPIIYYRRCFDLDDEIQLKDFVASANKYKNEEILIIDIRGNQGGSTAWGDMWFMNYIGQHPKAGASSLYRYGTIYKKFISEYSNVTMVDFLARYDMPELNEFFDNYMKSNEDAINSVESTYKINKEEYEWIKSNRLIFLLIDNGNASSSEDFIIDLKTIENVVTIGTNTGGFMEVSDNGVLCLPNSSIGVYLGVGLNMQREAPYFYDGVGIEPDIWIANDQILDKVLNMIELYKENR